MIWYLLGIALALLVHAFFAGSETGMISVSALKLRHWVEQGHKSAKVAYHLLSQPERLLSTTLVGINVALVTASSLTTSLFITRMGPERGTALATVVVTAMILLYGEILPKTVFRQRADQIVPYIALPIHWSGRVLWPVVFVTTQGARSVARLFGASQEAKSPFVTKEEIRLLVEEIGDEGVLESHERGLIRGVLDFTRTPVSQVMVPASQMIPIDHAWPRERIEQLSRTHNLTRFPVFREHTPVGFINVFDLFYHEGDWQGFIRPIRKVRPGEHIDLVIADMQAKKQNIALVTDGDQVVGMITIQDLMEAILSRMRGSGTEEKKGSD